MGTKGEMGCEINHAAITCDDDDDGAVWLLQKGYGVCLGKLEMSCKCSCYKWVY